MFTTATSCAERTSRGYNIGLVGERDARQRRERVADFRLAIVWCGCSCDESALGNLPLGARLPVTGVFLEALRFSCSRDLV